MYRQSLRTATSSLARAVPRQQVSRRCISTAPPHEKSRSLRSSAVRWGLAGALVYYYNTSSAFAEEPQYAMHAPPETSRENEVYPTLEAVAAQRKSQSTSLSASSSSQSPSVAVADGESAAPGSPEELEEEAGQQGAFNEETGEINWDCPCLGGMANGSCGEQFKAAFSCFVYSKEDPKGVDCIEHFKTMQNCFREHPEEYGAELDDEDAPPMAIEGGDDPAEAPASTPAPAAKQSSPAEPEPQVAAKSEPSPPPSLAAVGDFHDGKAEKAAVHRDVSPASDKAIEGRRDRAIAATEQVERDHGTPTSESKSAVPKSAHDAR
ncbi:Oxidoreductase [Recurvomyces mirabilis]|uniref:Mitochondrial intermembrane space import and assembly protein 40 n=1 Tax=Recurvomyces mirabilis TaxID=574656 RepID=A0AAE0WII0_9PEZI|nr:Oxidoreductase [Recurvomyces mirabilis]KAK5156379.1 Oxidoreductase [Recurvomyces mirabilis]